MSDEAAPRPWDSHTTAFVFPGQGAQKVGMGADWAAQFPAARAVFEEVDEALGFALSKLCWEGPEEELQLTANTQPALLVTAIAIHRVVVEHGLGAGMLAGHSLGEYSALVAAGALDLATAVRLVRRRGELMQEAVPVGQGAMAAVMGLADADLLALCADAAAAAGEGQICTVANFNSPGQTVIAGHTPAVERAVELAKGRGARKATLLKVSAPFHSPLMAPAREGLTPDLEATAFRDPRPAVVTNVDARPVTTAAAARAALIRQIDAPVRWVESVEWMAAGGPEGQPGAQRFLELGPAKVLSALIRRTVEGVESLTIDSPATLAEILEA